MSERGIVEAALFSAGRVVSVEELADATRLPAGVVRDALRALKRSYAERESAVEVAEVGDRWTMQIRADYAEKAESFAPPEIPRDLLKTLALIAYHQPLRQSDLYDMIGSKVYEHSQALEGMRLIARKPAGRTFELTTTGYFVEFFGVHETDREGIRRMLAERTGAKYIGPGSGTNAPPPGTPGASPATAVRPDGLPGDDADG